MSIERLKDEKLSDWMARDIAINLENMSVKDAVKKTLDETKADPKDYWKIKISFLDGKLDVHVEKDADYTFAKLLKNGG